MKLDQAIDIVAQQMIQNAVDDWQDDGWEQIPDIGEFDYGRVATRMREMCPFGELGDFDTAMGVLEQRAEQYE